MNREAALRTADQWRGQARVLTTQGELTRARDLLLRLVGVLLASIDDDGDAHAAVARALSDAYGMLGGVQRRIGDLAAAVAAYVSGRDIEQDERYGIVDSYNLTNAIVLRLLIEPAALSSMGDELVAARTKVKAQVEGARRAEWWAWADYGLLCLLSGEYEEAERAYALFGSRMPNASDYQSVQRVLRDLAEAVDATNTGVAARLAATANSLVL